MILGIDEAGRGPVMGPLVICGILIEDEDEKKLKAINVKDSKLLTPDQREAMFERIVEIAKYKLVLVIEPNEIDDAVNRKNNLNLNWLEAVKTAQIVNDICDFDKKLTPDKIIVDCPSTNVLAYASYLSKRIHNKKIRIVAEHKADLKYPVVSAASIIAKVTRDREIEKLKQEIGMDFGSGYPSDPYTKEFLKKNYNRFPNLFRKSWSTYKIAAGTKQAKTQKKLGEF